MFPRSVELVYWNIRSPAPSLTRSRALSHVVMRVFRFTAIRMHNLLLRSILHYAVTDTALPADRALGYVAETGRRKYARRISRRGTGFGRCSSIADGSVLTPHTAFVRRALPLSPYPFRPTPFVHCFVRCATDAC